MMTNSPWAKFTGVALGGPDACPAFGGGDGAETREVVAVAAWRWTPAAAPERGGDHGGARSVGSTAVEIVARWQSALPIKAGFRPSQIWGRGG